MGNIILFLITDKDVKFSRMRCDYGRSY